MKIITVSREFGSGGRELGKRLSDLLGFAYYDREIIAEVAKQSDLNEGYIEKMLDNGLLLSRPLTFRRTLSYASAPQDTAKLLVVQQKIMKELCAKGDCVMVGRSANVVLRELKPFNLFVYADMTSKIMRCQERAMPDEYLPKREMEKQITRVDAGRARCQELISNFKWGDKEGYHLCVNTSGLQIKEIAPLIAEYARFWTERNET